MKIKDPKDPTKEIEVFTAEEVAAKVTAEAGTAATKAATEALEKYQKEHPDNTAELDKLKNDLAKAQSDLEGALKFDDGSPERKAQIERLRQERDTATGALNKTIADLTAKVEGMVQGQTATAKAALLDKFAGKDPEARKKVEFEFDRYDPTNNTPEGMAQRMEKAAGLAGVTTPPAPGAMDHGAGGGARGEGNYGGGGIPKATENAVAIGKSLGVSKEDIDKHIAKKAEEGNK